jgi:hypothetical protein
LREAIESPEGHVNRIAACRRKGKIAESSKDQSERHEVARVAAIGPSTHKELADAVGDCGYSQQVADLTFAVAKRLADFFGDNGEIVSDEVEDGISNKCGFHDLPSQPWINALDLIFGKPRNMHSRPKERKVPTHEYPRGVPNLRDWMKRK